MIRCRQVLGLRIRLLGPLVRPDALGTLRAVKLSTGHARDVGVVEEACSVCINHSVSFLQNRYPQLRDHSLPLARSKRGSWYATRASNMGRTY